jgi:hypothetical protein
MPSNKPEYDKKYYSEHKDKMLKQLIRKVHCPLCNKDISMVNLFKHNRTKKHTRLFAQCSATCCLQTTSG